MEDARMEVPALVLFFFAVGMVFLAADSQSINGSTHFTFLSFNRNTSGIVYMGNASVSNISDGINLTPDPNATQPSNVSLQNCIGRVLYYLPVTVWPASFTTTFTILIQKISNADGTINYYGDGLAFAIFGNDRLFLPESYGSYMGLFDPSTDGNATGQLAVEFDTYKNEWDPNANHVGIDVKGIKSDETANFGDHDMDLKSGKPISVRVDYDGWSKNLQIRAAYTDSGGPLYSLLNVTIDLSTVVPRSAYLGFSAATGNSYEIHRVLSWNFSSRILPESSILLPPVGVRAPQQAPGESSSPGLKIGLLVGGLVGIVTLVGGLSAWLVVKKRRRKQSVSGRRRIPSELARMETRSVTDASYAPHRFTYKQLAAATNNFSDAELLGSGGFGSVYRGFLAEDGGTVAVKRISASSRQGEREFISEISTIGRLRHRNLVQLQGWCHERDELLLVYEYMPNGSLDKILFEPQRDDIEQQAILTWQRRYKVLCGLGAALLYLHEEWEQRVIHRDVKPSNVMLDAEFNARLGDFGLARLIEHEHDDTTSGITTMLAGTPGYVAPECGYTGKATAESDVFSFGIVVLEVATGRRVVERKPPLAEGNLVDRVWGLYGQGRIIECADPKLKGEFEPEQMERVLILGLSCSHPDPQLRPSMRKALQVLINPNEESPLLPSSRPLAIYVVLPPGAANRPSTSSSSNAAAASTSSSAISGVTSITASTLLYGR